MEYCVECDSKDKHKEWCSEAGQNSSNSALSAGVIKPCPFCGSSASLKNDYTDNEQTKLWSIQCENTNCKACIVYCESESDILKRWNMRIKAKRVNPCPNPRYDDIYFKGVAELDKR